MTPDQVIQKMFRWRAGNLPYYPRRMKRHELPAIYKELGFKKGAEVGTRQGIHAEEMCKAMPDLELHCVDPYLLYSGYENRAQTAWDNFYAEAQQRLAPYNVTFHRGTSMERVDDFPDGSLDFVYIDGNHDFDYVITDIINWSPKVKLGGIIALHDFEVIYTDVCEAILSYTRSHYIDPWYTTRDMHPTAFWVRKEEHGSNRVR